MKIVIDPWGRSWKLTHYNEYGEEIMSDPDSPDYATPGYAAEAKQAYEIASVRGSRLQVQDLRVPKVRTIVNEQILELERQLAERRELLKQLDEQPATEKLLDTMRRLGV